MCHIVVYLKFKFPFQGAAIKVHVKTPKEKKTIETRERAEVKDFKAAISEAFSAPQEQLCLIYAGKILKVHPYMFGDKALKNYEV